MTDKTTRVDAGPMEGLFFALAYELDVHREELENGRTVCVAFSGVREDEGHRLPDYLAERFAWEGIRLALSRTSLNGEMKATFEACKGNQSSRGVVRREMVYDVRAGWQPEDGYASFGLGK